MKYKGMEIEPIHKIIWRLPWYIIVLICTLIGTGAVFLGWGKYAAKDYWNTLI